MNSLKYFRPVFFKSGVILMLPHKVGRAYMRRRLAEVSANEGPYQFHPWKNNA